METQQIVKLLSMEKGALIIALILTLFAAVFSSVVLFNASNWSDVLDKGRNISIAFGAGFFGLLGFIIGGMAIGSTVLINHIGKNVTSELKEIENVLKSYKTTGVLSAISIIFSLFYYLVSCINSNYLFFKIIFCFSSIFMIFLFVLVMTLTSLIFFRTFGFFQYISGKIRLETLAKLDPIFAQTLNILENKN